MLAQPRRPASRRNVSTAVTRRWESCSALRPCAEHPAIGEVFRTGPNGLARCPRGHSDCHRDGDRRGQAGYHPGQDRQDGEHDADRYPQDTMDERAPRRLVDAEYRLRDAVMPNSSQRICLRCVPLVRR